MKHNISFVIPCYNSARTIGNVVKEIQSTVRKNDSYEIILVNDGSKDDAFEVISSLAEKDPRITAIDLIRNFGQHAAIMTGLRYTSKDIVICLDDDGQTPADEFYKLVEELDSGSDVVYARYTTKHHQAYRNLGSRLNDWMMRVLLKKPKELYISSYFACRRLIVDEIVKYDKSFPYLQGLMLRTTNRITNVVVDHRSREIGESGYTLGKLIGLWMNGFTTFSIIPLRIATFVGCFTSLTGFLYALYLIIKKITNGIAVLGYSSLMASILFIGGLIMLMLGLIGEYIGRIYISLNSQPQAIVRTVVKKKQAKPSN